MTDDQDNKKDIEQKENINYEFSSGGVVLENKKVLLIQVKTLRGLKIWTFPKGHIEKGESPLTAAKREILEETGYKSSIIKPILKNRFGFKLKNKKIIKTVQWYLMKSLGRFDSFDKVEVLNIKWVSINKAKEIVSYPSDLKMLDIAQEYIKDNYNSN